MSLTFPNDFARGEDGVWVPADGTVGAFAYSDGDEVEQRMLAGVNACADRSVLSHELNKYVVDWPTRYHFSPRRANLLRPFSLTPEMKLLEIGAGCGAVTRYLGEVGCDVVAVEGSHLRARIAAARTSGLSSCKVVSCPFEDLQFTAAFDVVVLVGVIEYAAWFNRSENPHVDLLRRASQLLVDDGVIILATENRLGAKYLAGAAEDHLGVPYVGVNDAYSADGIRTFTRHELHEVMEQAGLPCVEYLTPLPDYKLVRSVIRFETAPREARETLAQLVVTSFCDDPQIPVHPSFSLEQLGASTARGDLAIELANAFLVVAGNSSAGMERVLPGPQFAWHYTVERAPVFTKETELYVSEPGGFAVRRRSLFSAIEDRIDGDLRQVLSDEPLWRGRSLLLDLVKAVNRQGWTVRDAADAVRPWAELATSIMDEFGMIPGSHLDLTPFNVVVTEEGPRAFDQEWIWYEPIPLGYTLLRGLICGIPMITSFAAPEQGVPLKCGQLAYAIAHELVRDRMPAPQTLGDFIAWFARVQAGASGQAVEQVGAQLTALWLSELRVRA